MIVREEDIRTHIEAWLRQQGVSVEREVVCGNGIRADLVTPDTVIEVKKYLNRGALYQAHGQGAAYQKLLKKPKLLIIGLAPVTAAKYQEAQRIAENIRTDAVDVVFLDKDPKWAQAAMSVSVSNPAAPTQPVVKLPFEPSAQSKKTAASPSTKSTQEPLKPSVAERMALTGKDVWALLLIILLFLWVKAALWHHQTEIDPAQPDPELTLPSQNQ